MARRLGALTTLVLAAPACATLLAGPPRPTGEPRFLNFAHREEICTDPSRVSRDAVTRVRQDLSAESPLDETVRRLMCTDHPEGGLHRELYRRHRPEEVNPAAGALMVMACVGEGPCARLSGGFSYGTFTTMLAFARFEPGEVERAFAAVALRQEVRDALILRYIACRTHMLETRDAMEPRMRAVYLETVAEATRRHAAVEAALAPHRAAYEALRPRLDAALLEGRAPPELLDEARSLRDALVSTCLAAGGEAETCFGGPLALPLGEALARLAAAAGDAPLAHAEARLVSRWAAVADVRYAIHLAVDRAIDEERDRAGEYRRALEAGVSPEAALARFGGVPPAELGDRANQVGLRPPERRSRGWLSAELRPLPPVELVTGRVGAVRLAAGRARLHLEADSPTRRAEPVELPRAEAEPLVPGEVVELVVDPASRRAAVELARASGEDRRLVQVRGVRIPPPPR